MKLGTYTIPNYPLSESVEAIKRVYEQCGRNEITREHIAQILGFNAQSGGFNMRLSDLKVYGFIEGRGRFHVTELAVKATFGTTQEKERALDEAVRTVPLWQIFCDKWKTNLPADTFWIDLADITGIERSESKKEADKISKLYLDDIRYILPIKVSEKMDEIEPISDLETGNGSNANIITTSMNSSICLNGEIIYLKLANIGEFRLEPNNAMNIDIAIQILNSLKARFENKMESPQEILAEISEN